MSTWQDRAEKVLAQGCLTYSKSRRYYVSDQPSHVVSSTDQYLIDPVGIPMLDTTSGLGANLITIKNSYSLPSTLEVECAERLVSTIGRPGWKVKFVKTGSEADQAAVRFARGYQKRTGVFRLGYSGWHNEFIGAEAPGVGCIPTDVVVYHDLRKMIDHVRVLGPAVVILEPVRLDIDDMHLLKDLRSACDATGAILIYDEVITAFRMPRYTVAATSGVYPDVLTTGKAIGGGYPLGVVMGRADIMDVEGVFVSGTFSGETCALRAAMGVMDEMTPTRMQSFYRTCQDFHTALQWELREHINCQGYGTRIVLKDKVEGADMVPRYMQEMYVRHRILIGPVLFPRAGWSGEYGKIISATRDVASRLSQTALHGPSPKPVFKR